MITKNRTINGSVDSYMITFRDDKTLNYTIAYVVFCFTVSVSARDLKTTSYHSASL